MLGRTHSFVQGVEAGGHRGSFVDSDSHEDYGILALLSLVSARAAQRSPQRPLAARRC